MSPIPFPRQAPLSIGRIGLKARDAEGLAEYYRTAVGLQELSRSGGTITLGAGSQALLVLEPDPAARPDDPRMAGLFHTAFLLPSRADLGRWLRHAAERRIRIDGASDHLVSEAIYLTDPEGNGIEIYADRPPEVWPREGDEVQLATLRLDLDDVVSAIPEGDEGWRGAPEGTVIGHVHLRVGDPEEAERWWRETLGFDLMARYGNQAVFLATGGYHHHVGANSWHSAGAGRRDPARSGLAWVEIASREPATERDLEDPWGSVIRLR